MKKHALRVRSWGVLAILGLAGLAAGCDASNPVRPSPLGSRATEATASTSATSSSESVSDVAFPVGPELASVRQATAAFHDISAAYRAGYTTENEPCVASPDGVMGVHAPNFAFIGNQSIDPTRPELLLYEPKANGGYRLVGVEYFQVTLLRNRQTQEVGPRFDVAPWDPAAYEVVNQAPNLFGQTFHLDPPPVPTVPWHWSLHVWIWAHNPRGMFADWNPSLRCD